MKLRYGLKIGDFVLISVTLLTSVFLFLLPFAAKQATNAQLLIAETGEVRPLPLHTNKTYHITTSSGSLTVCVKAGTVSVSHSDCRDGICVRTPPISHPGQSIVCAPAGVVVRITGEEAMVDGVSG